MVKLIAAVLWESLSIFLCTWLSLTYIYCSNHVQFTCIFMGKINVSYAMTGHPNGGVCEICVLESALQLSIPIVFPNCIRFFNMMSKTVWSFLSIVTCECFFLFTVTTHRQPLGFLLRMAGNQATVFLTAGKVHLIRNRSHISSSMYN